jgi:hypothetical protein
MQGPGPHQKAEKSHFTMSSWQKILARAFWRWGPSSLEIVMVGQVVLRRRPADATLPREPGTLTTLFSDLPMGHARLKLTVRVPALINIATNISEKL